MNPTVGRIVHVFYRKKLSESFGPALPGIVTHLTKDPMKPNITVFPTGQCIGPMSPKPEAKSHWYWAWPPRTGAN